jgi:hypothetical protein
VMMTIRNLIMEKKTMDKKKKKLHRKKQKFKLNQKIKSKKRK